MDGKTLKNIAMACAGLFALGASLAQPAHAVGMTYSVANEAGSTWRYSYTLTNDSLAAGISEFRIFFALGDFETSQWRQAPRTGIPSSGSQIRACRTTAMSTGWRSQARSHLVTRFLAFRCASRIWGRLARRAVVQRSRPGHV